MKRAREPGNPQSLPPWLRLSQDCVTIEIAARPGSPRRGILRVGEQGPVIGIGAPAENGKANRELMEIVADLAGVSRAAVSVVKGAGSRRKVLRIVAADTVSAAKRLIEALSAQDRNSPGE
jgi:uncharacterized protein (TIGR00251 family)